MKKNVLKLVYDNLFFENIDSNYIHPRWIKWINNRQTTKYLNYHPKNKITENDLKLYFESSKNTIFFFRCYHKQKNFYFANLRIYKILNNVYSFGRLIGEKSYLNKGYGKKLALAAMNLIFLWLNAKRIVVGNIKVNKKSAYSKISLGFKLMNNAKIKKLKLKISPEYEYYEMERDYFLKINEYY